jgi:hypothetical protein
VQVLAHSDSRWVVLFGVRDLIVVDTGDAILVAHRAVSPRVGLVTKEFERRGLLRDLSSNESGARRLPWRVRSGTGGTVN